MLYCESRLKDKVISPSLANSRGEPWRTLSTTSCSASSRSSPTGVLRASLQPLAACVLSVRLCHEGSCVSGPCWATPLGVTDSDKVLKMKTSPQWDHRAPCLGRFHHSQPPAGLLVLTGLCDVQARPRSEETDTKEMILRAELRGM